MSLNWRKIDYFPRLMKKGPHANSALEMMVDDLHKDKNHTIGAFLSHFGAEDFMWALVRMLSSENCRVAGNSAYIFGTLAEHGHGQSRVMSLINGEHPHNILADLTTMLEYDDTESVMNAAGTLGTLAESDAGREWMLRESCVDITIGRVTELLTSSNMWTASNAALVLARLSIAEEGSRRLLDHHHSQTVITKLIDSLGIDEAGRGMNAAFAIGRLCDLDDGRKRLLHHKDANKMITSLCNMLSSKDPGCGKNACYALSCLAGSDEGHDRLLTHRHSELMLIRLGEQLSNEDSETGWFAAMTLRTLASKRKGCLRLRGHPGVIPPLKEIHEQYHPHQELKEEVDLTLALLKKLEQPDPPVLEVKGAQEIHVHWDPPKLRSGMEAKYRLFMGASKIYEGKELDFTVTRLRPNMPYNFKIQVFTEQDDSPMSDFVTATTEESAPDAPEAIRALQVTTSQVKLGWSPPEFDNGALKGYYVYNGKHQVESTSELSCIVSGLTPDTSYDFYVCAYNYKGKGPKTKLNVTTTDLGKHAPAKPSLTVRGRNQIHVTWAYPEFPLGRFHRFDLTQNGKVIYSGVDLNFTACRLNEHTDYTFTVIAVTSEGKCESEPAKKRTPKAEYKVQSTAPIFFSHPSKTVEQDAQDKHKDKTGSKQGRSKRSITSPTKHSKSIRSSSPNSTAEIGESVPRPLSAMSSMSSVSKSKHRRKSTGTVDRRKTKKLGAITALKEDPIKMSSSATSSDSEDEEDRWPGSDAISGYERNEKVLTDKMQDRHRHLNSNEYEVSLRNKNRTVSASTVGDTSTTYSGEQRRTKSDSGVATSLGDDEDAMSSFPISVKIKTSSAPVQGHKEVKGQKGHFDGDVTLDSVDDADFESTLYSQTLSSSQRTLYAQTLSSSQRLSTNVFIPVTDMKGVPIANVKEGAVDNLYSGSRNPRKQASVTKFNNKTSELEREAKKLDKLLSSLKQDSPRGKTTKQHAADVLKILLHSNFREV
ncbi:uncharacterized protein [Amphiura filiformis]|uniref:uncharacterized protein n=1 Tax=Amphiura filiformis TaxID=82378 RepID=UPI003B22157E